MCTCVNRRTDSLAELAVNSVWMLGLMAASQRTFDIVLDINARRANGSSAWYLISSVSSMCGSNRIEPPFTARQSVCHCGATRSECTSKRRLRCLSGVACAVGSDAFHRAGAHESVCGSARIQGAVLSVNRVERSTGRQPGVRLGADPGGRVSQ